MELAFFDTNILVYLFDADYPEKQRQTEVLVSEAMANGSLMISTQVLQEFYVITTRKLEVPLTSEQAEQAIRDLLAFTVVSVGGEMVLDAIQLCRRYELSFWDSLIIQAALEGGAGILYSEDLQNNQRFGALRIVNSFDKPNH
ncbi:MAG: hypothetical protein AXA67_12065 [Methylothermaceae bacteria B42]|nr:MAG: hypothetical protein AXA67_12065 [Methylothermaceae bacteria B42]HHJ39266.1 PIN domain-containing protein [Methylothermaceae bacterium]